MSKGKEQKKKCYVVEVTAMDGTKGYWYFADREKAERKAKDIFLDSCKLGVYVVTEVKEVNCSDIEII